MRTSVRSEIGQLAVIAAMFVAGAVTLPNAPERIATRFNAQGEATGYGDPAVALFFPPALALAIYLLLRFVPLIDPGRANYATFAGAYSLIRWAVLLLQAGAYALIHAALRGIPVDTGILIPVGVGVLLILLGNVMGKIRPNWFVGIRTPWTLSSKLSWTRTHALGGRVFVGMGIAWIVVPLGRLVGLGGGPGLIPLAVAVSLGGVAYLVAYSFVVWRSDPERIPPAGTQPAEQP